jgi:GNAT superfamily N-acetyltransferase/acetolactate synthase small subunit
MNSYGLVFGGEKTSHDSGNDIAYNVVSGNDYTKVVIEGDEYILPKEAMQSEKVYDFVDKLPIEMLDEIKRSENVFIRFPNLRQGDMVVCKNSVRNDDLHTIKGTAKEIGNYLQGLSACRMYAKGGYISGELANGGGVEDESQLRLLTPMPPTKLGKTGIDSLTEIVGKDEMRPAFSGALYAGKGRIVATDAHILVVLENQNYPKSLEGTIKSLWNKVPQERLIGIPYPNWEAVVPNQQNFQTKELSIDDVLAYAYGGFLEGKNIIKEKDFNKYQKEKFKYVLRLNIGNIEIGIDSLLLTRILRTLKANDVRKIVFHIGQTNQRPIKITTDNKHYGLIMPVMIADKVEDLGEAIYVSQQIFYPISDKDFRAMSKKYGEYLTEFSKMVGEERMAEGGEITMNVPLLLRVLELAKEEVKEDKELHFIAERLQTLSKKGTLTMEDYDYISGLESNDKIQKLIAENDSNDSDLRFEQGGEIKKKSELLAPNGKPSNLTPEQWHLVRTPEFKAWFGDWEALENAKTRDKGMDEVTLKNLASNVSKVVDENGEPLVVYHFSNMDFNVFELKGLSDGFFFTKNVEDEEFSQKGWLKSMGLTIEQSMEKGYDLKYEKGNPYFLNIKQFYIKENVKNSLWSTPYFENVVIEFAKRNKTNDGVEFLREIDNKQIVVAFYPEQIKLADGSNTTFDSNNPDIRFEKGGGVEDEINPEQIRAEIEALGEVLKVLEGEDRQLIQDEVEILKLALGELEYTKLLAPNGKPSNLTTEQWLLVRTPEFKAWFGDWENLPQTASKVVDENGEPLVVFREIKATEKNYFNTEVENFAISQRWQTNLDEILTRKLPSETKVGDEVSGFNKRGVVTEINNGIFKIKYEDGSVFSGNAFGLTFYGEKKPKKVISAFLNIRILGGNEKLFVHSFGVQKDSGILSISPDYKTYFTFRSNQVKLADGSNTTFDANNPDIRFERGGGVKKPKFKIISDEEEGRTEISLDGIGKVILAETYPKYEFVDDIGGDALEDLGLEEEDLIGKIEHIEVNNQYKGKGYGRLLMKKAIEVAKDKGLMPLYLNASPMGYEGLDIYNLTSFYESFGFKVFLEQGNNNLMILNEAHNYNNPDIRFEKGGRVSKMYQIMQKYKYDLQPKWEVEKFQTGGRYFLTFADAQKMKKRLQKLTSSFQFKVVSVEENPEPMPEEEELNPEQIRAEIEALEEVLEVLESEDRKLIQEEIEILKFALGELEHTKLLAPI